MPTHELEAELAATWLAFTFDEPVPDGEEARYLRVARELARRDYRFRSHGKGCCCSDCMYLLDQWLQSRRRWFPEVVDFPADPR